jgi:shikimate dehydrogenase
MGVRVGTADAAGRADLVVNCTTVGMSGEQMPVDPRLLRGTVVDLAYSDRGETALVRAARERGLRAIDGIEVLVHQAIASLEIWLGTSNLAELAGELRKAALA